MRLTIINKHSILFIGILFLFCHSKTHAQLKQKFTLVIDAGHGGDDTGTRGHHEYEKYIALDVALKLGDMIEKKYKKDVNIIYTRKTDVFIPLWKRAEIANRNKADLFVSIHCNSARRTSAMGTETFVMGLSRMDENIEVSKRENAVVLLEDNYQERYQSFDPNNPEAVIMFNMMHSTYQEQSIAFADLVEKNFVKRGRFSRGVKQNIFHVLRETAMPSVLIEIGFISNYDDAQYLNSSHGKKETAEAIFESFASYKKEYDRKNGNTSDDDDAPKEKVVVTKEKPVKGLIYKIQFLTSKYKYSASSVNFKGLTNVEVRKAGDVYKYYYGETNLKSKRDELLTFVKRKGFPDAFFVEVPTKEVKTNTYYRIQVLASNRRYGKRARQLRPLKDVDRVKEDNMYYYFYGKAKTNQEAEKLLEDAKKKGFRNAFIVEVDK